MTDINEKFVTAIIASMTQQDISQGELARRIESNQPTIRRILIGETKLSLERAMLISAALGCKFKAVWADQRGQVQVHRERSGPPIIPEKSDA